MNEKSLSQSSNLLNNNKLFHNERFWNPNVLNSRLISRLLTLSLDWLWHQLKEPSSMIHTFHCKQTWSNHCRCYLVVWKLSQKTGHWSQVACQWRMLDHHELPSNVWYWQRAHTLQARLQHSYQINLSVATTHERKHSFKKKLLMIECQE